MMAEEGAMRSRRALLYTPGDDERKVRKAAGLDVDCVCLDLEDGVAAGRKQAARETVARALQTLDFGRSERLCRINAPGSGLEQADLEAVLPARPDGVLVPKVSDAEQVRRVSARLEAHERAQGWQVGGIRLLVLVESARAVLNLPQIAAADPRLAALIFGAEDLAGDLGATRTPEAWEVFYARSAVVTAAAAFGLQALDMVCVDFRDLESLRAEALQGAALGFAGKQAIHPDQVAPVQEAFTPSPQAITRAQRLVEAYRQHQAAGAGAFAVDGKMVDRPMVRAAEGLLARARAAGVIE
jgi:citrate lyase beta subunit